MEGMPRELRILLSDRKPTTGEEAGRMADNYVHSRQLDHKEQLRGPHQASSENGATKTCYYCKSKGHISRDCSKAMADRTKEEGKKEAIKVKAEWNKVRCYNCQEIGHIASNCPGNFNLFTEETEMALMNEEIPESINSSPQITRPGKVEGNAVEKMVLDTGFERSLSLLIRELISKIMWLKAYRTC